MYESVWVGFVAYWIVLKMNDGSVSHKCQNHEATTIGHKHTEQKYIDSKCKWNKMNCKVTFQKRNDDFGGCLYVYTFEKGTGVIV